MKRILLIIGIILFFTNTFSHEYFSLLDNKKIIRITDNTEYYELDFQNIIANSEIVTVQNDTLQKGINYKIFYKEGRIKILKPYTADTEIIVTFKVFPKKLKYSFSKFKKQVVSGKEEYRPLKETQQKPVYSSSNLNISGSKSFAISVGNKEDVDLEQSLYLQIDGELSDKIFIKAQLSDNNSPIAPEGTTKKLSEFDKMFIKVHSGNYSISFGDFFAKFDDTYFANYDYKLEGVNFMWEGAQSFEAAAAVSNGDFMSYKFYGTEGIQGPYYLPGKNSSSTKVLAGTEKIYLNGKLLTRGEDYSIDYNEGSLTFNNNIIITEDSYIIADYEYSAEDYRSNIYLSSGYFSFLDANAQISFKVLSNNDDKNKPLNFSFSKDDKEILANAGDDPKKARKNGADTVAIGEGNYTLVDSYYVYVGFDSTGNYFVSFSYVGQGYGSYQKSGYNQFEWKGKGNGDYIPEIQLPLPNKRFNLDFSTKLKFALFSLYSEGIYSNYDKNSFSEIDDKNDNGYALYNKLNFTNNISTFGKTNISFFYKYRDKNFYSLARTESAKIEYETAGFIDADTVEIHQYGSNVDIELHNWAKNYVEFSEKNMKNIAKQSNFSNRFSYIQNKSISFLPSFNYSYSLIKEKTKLSASSNNQQIKQQIHDLNGEYKYDFFDVQAGYYERQQTFTCITYNGLRLNKNFYKTNLNFKNIKISLGYERENQDSLKTDWKRFKNAYLLFSNLYYGYENFNINSNYSHRENRYFNGEKDTKFDLFDNQLSINLLKKSISNRINYKIGNIEIYPKVKQLIYVGQGNGSYSYIDSVLVYEGPGQGDYEYEITRVGTPTPVTELQVNWYLNINPGRALYHTNTELGNFLGKFLFTSDISIQEESKTPYKLNLYLLKKKALMNEKYTDYGFQRYKAQLWYNIKKNKIVARFLYEKTKKMDNRYENEFDKLWQDDYNLSLNIFNVNKWNFENKIGFKDKTSNYQTAEFLKSKIYSISTDIGYKFNYNMILSSTFGYNIEDGIEENSSNSYRISSYIIEPKFVYNVGSKYHFMVQVYFQDNKSKGSDYPQFNWGSNNFISKRNGLTTRFTLQFDYRFSKYVTGFLKYYSEKYPESDVRHQLKMEVRADF
ncbi:MAG: hypothetical protein ISS28_04965 [Candidatus Cloacimonetes bacterium]|nr:hypothetical protein [Candidatus Cloacimonadota bacterium]MBL7086431.1 hypothetical protein [Candidatus Cloacimonadota bacterium]